MARAMGPRAARAAAHICAHGPRGYSAQCRRHRARAGVECMHSWVQCNARCVSCDGNLAQPNQVAHALARPHAVARISSARGLRCSTAGEEARRRSGTYTHAYRRTHIRTRIPGCIHTYMDACIRTYIHTFIHTYTRTYTRTCIHTHIHTYRYI